MPSSMPKEHLSRERDHRRLHQERGATVSGGEPFGPTLTELTGRDDWSPQTRQWYEAWRTSPQVRLFVSQVEWEILHRGCLLVEQYFDPKTSANARVLTWNALRLAESQLGATHADRVGAHIKVRTEAPPEPTPTVDYRKMLA